MGRGLRGLSPTLVLRHGPDSYGGSSEEYCAMDESLTQPCRVQDDGATRCKLLLYAKKPSDVSEADGSI